MTTDMQTITPGTQVPVTCPACRRRLSLLAAAGDGVLARGRCICGHALSLVESTGEDGLPVRYVVTDTRRTFTAGRPSPTRRSGRRLRSEADPL